MAVRFDTITFLSDYGTADEFVGVVKSVIRQIAPHVTVVDLTHEVPAYDVRAGSLTLGRAAHLQTHMTESNISGPRRDACRRHRGLCLGDL